MDDALAVLRHEFAAEDRSFFSRLRCELEWDRQAFTRLERAMRAVCERYEGRDVVERWLAEGYYHASSFVRDWSSHPSFPRPEHACHQACLERLTDLADWFFRGFHVYQTPCAWPDL